MVLQQPETPAAAEAPGEVEAAAPVKKSCCGN
jgi:hypothetical protein